MFYYFKDKHRLSEVKLEFKGQNYMFNSYEMELYSVGTQVTGPGTHHYLVLLLPQPAHLYLVLHLKWGGGRRGRHTGHRSRTLPLPSTPPSTASPPLPGAPPEVRRRKER
jgi:hypothetical protein